MLIRNNEVQFEASSIRNVPLYARLSYVCGYGALLYQPYNINMIARDAEANCGGGILNRKFTEAHELM